MLVVGVVTNVVQVNFDQPLALSTRNDALGHRAFEHPGKERQDVKTHKVAANRLRSLDAVVRL